MVCVLEVSLQRLLLALGKCLREILCICIVNREEGLEAGGVSDNMLKFWSRDNTSALESRLVIRAVQKIKLCLAIVNREEGLEAGGVSDNMLKFWSRDNTSALESRLVIRAVQKIKLCLAKRFVFLPRSRKS